MSGIIFSKSSGVNDSIFGKSQEPIKAIITETREAFEKESMIDKIFYMDKSKNFSEKYTIETSLGDFEPVGENGEYPTAGFQEGYSKVIEPETWKSSFAVTQEMVEDAKIGKIKSKARQFTTSYNRTREKYAAGLLGSGTATTFTWKGKTYNTACADGTALFNANHPSITDETYKQSNMFVGAFSVANLDKVQEKMQDFTDDDGNILTVMPNTIIIPNDATLKRQVIAAVGSDLDPNTANNALNFQAGNWNVIVWPYLPKTMGDKPYFMVADSQFLQDYMCLPFVDRVDLTVRSYLNDTNDANVFNGRARFAAGFNNWRGIAICGEGLTGGTTI